MKLPTKLLEKFSTQQKITVLVVAAHMLILLGFEYGPQQGHSASAIGDTVVANLLDPHPQQETTKKLLTPPTALIPQEKNKNSSTPVAAKQSPSSTTSHPESSPPASSFGGSSSGDPKTVSISQAQCSVPEPIYPNLSRRMGEEGKALVRLFINESGNIEKVTLVQSSGIPRLDQAALDAGQKARCKPFIESGKPIKVTAIQPYIFQLE